MADELSELEALCKRYEKRWRGEGRKIIELARAELLARRQEADGYERNWVLSEASRKQLQKEHKKVLREFRLLPPVDSN